MGKLPELDPHLQAAHELGAAGIAVIDHFLLAADARAVLDDVKALDASGAFRPAQIGRQGEHLQVEAIRGDHICWLTPRKAPSGLARFFVELARLRQAVNRALFMGLWRLECHATHYPPGAVYRRHFDAFAGPGRSREVSIVYYLVEDWSPEKGGLLRVHSPSPQDVAPLFGRLVIFRSELVEHEVTETFADRYSVTGWWSPRDLSPQAALRNSLDALAGYDDDDP